MTNSTVARLGQINAAGAVDALFLKQFGGEILTEFETNTVFKSRHFVRQISNGKTAQFPMIGSVTHSMHTPGNFIDGQTVNHAEMTITVDGLLVAPVFIASIDELMNHYDVRGPYSTEMGRTLAYEYDRNVARCGLLAARASSALTGRSGGSVITAANIKTDADVLVAALYSAAQTLDEKDVGNSDRSGFFKPAQYYLLAQNPKLLFSEYGGSANISQGTVKTVAGIELVKTNHLPVTDESADTSVQAKYRANNSNTAGLVMNRMAVGTVQLADISMDVEYETRRQGTFMVAKMAVGHDKLRVDCAVELAST